MDEAESLLKTEYHVYEHESGQPHIACTEYSLPKHIQDHVDFLTPTVHFDVRIKPRSDNKLERRQSEDQEPDAAKTVGIPGSGSLPKLGHFFPKDELIKELQQCDEQITPDCLRALYEFSANNQSNSENSYGKW